LAPDVGHATQQVTNVSLDRTLRQKILTRGRTNHLFHPTTVHLTFGRGTHKLKMYYDAKI